MLWLSQNHNNHAVIHEHLINLYEVHACNPDIIIIKIWDAVAPQNQNDNYVCVILMQLSSKFGMLWLPKIIMIIATSLTSNNFIDAPLIAIGI
jgi:hypothetical protein